MSVRRLAGDITLLPKALLPMAKRQERIQFCDDDQAVVEFVARAIAQFEQYSQMRLHAGEWEWKFKATDFDCLAGRIRCPLTPVSLIEIFDGDGNAITDGWELVTSSLDPVEIYYLEGAGFTARATVTTGYASPELMPPGVRDIVMKIAGHNYEYREILVPNAVDLQPLWLEQIMGPYWFPRC